MRQELNFWVLGGDMRQGKLAQLLSEDGHRVHAYALEEGVVPAGGDRKSTRLNSSHD